MDAETLRKGLNFTLTTDLGPLDLLGEMLGETLMAAKRAAGRPKDLEVLAELQALAKAR